MFVCVVLLCVICVLCLFVLFDRVAVHLQPLQGPRRGREGIEQVRGGAEEPELRGGQVRQELQKVRVEAELLFVCIL